MGAVVSLEQVSKRFVIHHEKSRSFQEAMVNLIKRRNGGSEEFWALRDVSFDVHAGETLGLIGENGAGKSTILKLITEILQPTSGSVSVQGKISALIELGAGFHPDLTGRENIFLNGSILGIGRREMARKYDEIVAFSELERFIDTPVKHYSSGMYMRLGFSVAISIDPDVLIVDEVLAVGDEAFQRKCLEKIAEFRRRGKTILFVSHAMGTIEALCDRVVWLHGGYVREQGPARRTIQAYMDELQRREGKSREAAKQVAAAYPDAIMGRPIDELAEPEIAFGGVELRDGAGAEKYSFETGERVLARLRCRVPDDASDWCAGFELRRNDGLLVYGTRFEEPLPPAGADGWREIEVEFTSLPLLGGSFELVPTLQRVEAVGLQPERGQACGFSVWGGSSESGLVHLESGQSIGRDHVAAGALAN
jgi:ABC-type polysaccharide/polyol phosphate transport system ATPase subunit